MRQEGTLPEMQELAEQIGEFIHYWGFKRVHGRIWTHLYLAQKPLDAADLVRQMKISKALVSISLRELLELEVIEEVGKSSRGTHLYRTNPDILKVILAVLRQREKRMLGRIHAAQEALERAPREEREKHGMSDQHISQLGHLVNNAAIALESFIAMKSVDFGDWRKAFLTTDLQQEAELRSRSVVAPSSRPHHDDPEPPSRPSGGGSTGGPRMEARGSGSLPVSAATALHEEPVLACGKGTGFRVY